LIRLVGSNKTAKIIAQIATIALAAAEDVIWVTIGAALTHCICTGAAVMGGRLLAARISVRTVTLVGGCIFVIFAIVTTIVKLRGDHDKAD
jgi:putative Ca2+/H+ antiporter (TMEM165/GDT1 family)